MSTSWEAHWSIEERIFNQLAEQFGFTVASRGTTKWVKCNYCGERHLEELHGETLDVWMRHHHATHLPWDDPTRVDTD